MRITILAGLLALLLIPTLRAGAVSPEGRVVRLTLAAVADSPATGTATLDLRAERATVTLDVRGLPDLALRGRSVYMLFLLDGNGRVTGLHPLPIEQDGIITLSLDPRAVRAARSLALVSTKPRAAIMKPAVPYHTPLLTGDLDGGRGEGLRRLAREFGPGWFAPLLPAALGLTLLRHARRLVKHEVRSTKYVATGARRAG